VRLLQHYQPLLSSSSILTSHHIHLPHIRDTRCVLLLPALAQIFPPFSHPHLMCTHCRPCTYNPYHLVSIISVALQYQCTPLLPLHPFLNLILQ
jgi:hypothetical protein